MTILKVLTIAGSDPSGGAGIQADLKTFSALGCYGMSVITALTAQNTLGVRNVIGVPADFLKDQIYSIFEDVRPAALKIGMVGDVDSILMLAECLRDFEAKNIVFDPVMVATSGDPLINEDAIEAMKAELVPMADIVTPNLPEAEILGSANPEELLSWGAKAVLMKGGHDLDNPKAIDVLATGDDFKAFEADRILTKNTHGTGCTLSAAIAAELAKGRNMHDAVVRAKDYITGAIKHADELDVGAGAGPVHHFWKAW